MELEFSGQIFEKFSNIKFHENPSSGSRVFSRRTDMTNRVVAFRNYANAPKNSELHWTVRWGEVANDTSDIITDSSGRSIQLV